MNSQLWRRGVEQAQSWFCNVLCFQHPNTCLLTEKQNRHGSENFTYFEIVLVTLSFLSTKHLLSNYYMTEICATLGIHVPVRTTGQFTVLCLANPYIPTMCQALSWGLHEYLILVTTLWGRYQFAPFPLLFFKWDLTWVLAMRFYFSLPCRKEYSSHHPRTFFKTWFTF